MVDRIIVGALQVNTYFVIDRETNQGIIIDPGAQVNRILEAIRMNHWEIGLILLTHGHFDHIGAAQELRDALGCKIVIHKEGQEYLEDPEKNLSSLFEGEQVKIEADQYITGTETEVEELIQDLPKSLSFKVLHAPGHTSDSAVFYFPYYNAAFVGDVIFKESVGRTDLAGGSWKTLENSIKTQVFTLPEETTLYPGHGPSTTVKYEKKYNPHFNLDF